MTITSFTDKSIQYQTTSDTCTCKAKEFNPSETCKHQRKAAKIEAGRPTTVNEARAARIERNRRTADSYYRMSFMPY